METKIEVWHNKSSLRKTCVNIPRCIPPLPPSSMLAPHIASFCVFSCPPSIKPARAIYNIEPGGKGGMKCHANVKCGTSISLSIYCLRVFFCTKFSRLAFPMGTLLLQKQRMVCFYRSRFFSFVFCWAAKGRTAEAAEVSSKHTVNTQ